MRRFYLLSSQRRHRNEPGRRDGQCPIYGADAAPGLIAYLTEAGIDVDHRDPQTLDEVKSQVADQTLDFALMIPEDFQDTMASYQPPDLLIVSDSSRNDVAAQVGQLRRVLNQ